MPDYTCLTMETLLVTLGSSWLPKQEMQAARDTGWIKAVPAKGGMVWKQVNRAALIPHCKIGGFLLIGFCCFPARIDSFALMMLKARLSVFSLIQDTPWKVVIIQQD